MIHLDRNVANYMTREREQSLWARYGVALSASKKQSGPHPVGDRNGNVEYCDPLAAA